MYDAASSSPRARRYAGDADGRFRRQPRSDNYRQDEPFTDGAWYEDEDYASTEADQSALDAPRFSLPSIPRVRAAASDAPGRGETSRRRAVGPATSGRRSALRRPPRQDDDGYADYDEDDVGFSPRSRVRSMARPLKAFSDSAPRLPALYDDAQAGAPARAAAAPRPPLPVAQPASERQVYRPAQLGARVRVHTQAIVMSARKTAKSPLTGVRFVLALVALSFAFFSSHTVMGEPPQPLMAGWQPGVGTHPLTAVAEQVVPETQGKRPDLYDSYQQFQDWWDAACSAATASEVLTAWGAPHATIGRLIDVMQPDISLNGGLLNYHGYERGAAAFGYRADVYMQMSLAQIRYVTNVLGLPVIVNVRISYGYYHYFDTGHFLVVTAGDSQGLRIADSSEYYIHYLPLAVFNSMYTGRAVVILPKDMHYTIAA